jgi:ABC-type uncharacterized transport system involved in gliding motility auxiliary subunit
LILTTDPEHRLGRLTAALVATMRGLNRPAADLVFALLLLTVTLLAGWLLARHDRSWDWSFSGRNSLSAESQEVLARLDAPLDIRAYAPPDSPLARSIEQVLTRYRRASDRVRVDYIDPQMFPELARAADVSLQGQLVLEYQDRRVSLGVLSERALTNAIARLQLQNPPWIAVLEGHGERAVEGGSGSDIGRLTQLLTQRGFRVRPLDLALNPVVPDNTDVLVVSMPVIAVFPGEAEALGTYLDRGGNLLWLLDPSDDETLLGLEPLRDLIGLDLLPGQVVDATAGDLRLDAPTFAVVGQWPPHRLTEDLDSPAVFPGAVALQVADSSLWRTEIALNTGVLSWNETGPVRGEISRDPDAGEQHGPLAVALLLQRALTRAPAYIAPHAETAAERRNVQRVAVVGDGDFLSNAHLERGGNKALALQLMRWLAHRDDLIDIPAPPNDRVPLVLSASRMLLLTVGALVLLPALLIMAGLGIQWWRQRA